MPSTALTNRKAAPLPRFFDRKTPRGVENLAPGINDAAAPPAPAPPVVGDAGTDATTH